MITTGTIPPRIVEAGQTGDKDGPCLEEQTHVEDAGQGEQQTSEDAHPPAETFFVKFRDCHHTHFAQGDHDETRKPDYEGDHPRDETDMKSSESACKPLLGRVHDGYQTEFATDHRGYTQMGFEGPSGYDVVAHVPDVPVGIQTDCDCTGQVKGDNRPVEAPKLEMMSLRGSPSTGFSNGKDVVRKTRVQ